MAVPEGSLAKRDTAYAPLPTPSCGPSTGIGMGRCGLSAAPHRQVTLWRYSKPLAVVR